MLVYCSKGEDELTNCSGNYYNASENEEVAHTGKYFLQAFKYQTP